MPLMKAEVRKVQDSKYGPNHKGVFATENIYMGEIVFLKDEVNEVWPYYPDNEEHGKYTKAQLLELFKVYPHVEEFVTRLSFLVDDDRYNAPLRYADEKFDGFDKYEDRFSADIFFNHSCDPTVIGRGANYYARRDIQIGEEITHNYILFDGECFMNENEVCQCGSQNCAKTDLNNLYRDPKWQEENEEHCDPLAQRRIARFRDADKK